MLAVAARRVYSTFLAKVTSEFVGLALHDKIYKCGAVAFLLYFAMGLIVAVLTGGDGIDTIAAIFVYLILTIFTVAVAVEYWSLIKWLYAKIWFKACLGAVAVLVYYYSQAHADDFINKFTGLDPSALPFASTVLATVYLPYSWLLAVSSVLAVFIFVHWFVVPFEPAATSSNIGSWKYLARFMGLLVVFVLLENTAEMFEEEDSLFVPIAKHLVIATEYFEHSGCTNVENKELTANIGRGYISVFSPEIGAFNVRVCALNRGKALPTD